MYTHIYIHIYTETHMHTYTCTCAHIHTNKDIAYFCEDAVLNIFLKECGYQCVSHIQ